MDAQPILETDRLFLRPFRLSDAADVQSKAGDYRVAEMTENIPHPYPDGIAEKWISNLEHKWINQQSATWAVCLEGVESLLGCVGLELNTKHRRASLGYWIATDHWGNGYCTEAARVVVDFGFNSLKLQRIEALHLTLNPASGAVMQKIGMVHEGTMKSYVLKGDSFEDMELYALLATDR